MASDAEKPVPESPAKPDQDRSAQRLQHRLLKLQRRASKTPVAEVIQELKPIWEKFRIKNLAKPKRQKLVQDVVDLVAGHLSELILKHDSSRIVQSLIKYATADTRSRLLQELTGQFMSLSSTAYGKFVVLKALKYARNAKWRSEIIKEFMVAKQLRKSIRHIHAGLVIDTIYCLYANAKERSDMLAAFYGSEFVLSRDGATSLPATEAPVGHRSLLDRVLFAFPDRKERILAEMRALVLSVAGKEGALGRHEIVHQIFLDFVMQLSLEQVQELVNSPTAPFRNLLTDMPSLVHTKPGSRLCSVILAACLAKERKIILKGFKSFVKQMVCDDQAWLVLAQAVYCVDDTVLTKQIIFNELFKDSDTVRDLVLSRHGRRWLLFVLAGPQTKYFSPDMVSTVTIRSEFTAVTCKKDGEQRRTELLKELLPKWMAWLAEHISEMVFDDLNASHLVCESLTRSLAANACLDLVDQVVLGLKSMMERAIPWHEARLAVDEHAADVTDSESEDEAMDATPSKLSVAPVLSLKPAPSNSSKKKEDSWPDHALLNPVFVRFLKRSIRDVLPVQRVGPIVEALLSESILSGLLTGYREIEARSPSCDAPWIILMALLKSDRFSARAKPVLKRIFGAVDQDEALRFGKAFQSMLALVSNDSFPPQP